MPEMTYEDMEELPMQPEQAESLPFWQRANVTPRQAQELQGQVMRLKAMLIRLVAAGNGLTEYTDHGQECYAYAMGDPCKCGLVDAVEIWRQAAREAKNNAVDS